MYQKQSKINQTWTKQWIKHLSTLRSGGVPGQVWRPLGPSWAIQRIFEGILDRLGGVLEASWAGTVANMAPTWPQVGSQVGAKMDKKSIQKSIKKLMPPGIGFWKDFGGFWKGKMEPSWHQNPSKIGISCEKAFFEKTLFFFRKNNDFEGSGGPSWE